MNETLSAVELIINHRESLLVFGVMPHQVGTTIGKTTLKRFGGCIFVEAYGIPDEISDCVYGDTILEVLRKVIKEWG
jgi:hypothetical protein